MHFVLYLWNYLGAFLCIFSRSWELIKRFACFTIFGAMERSSSKGIEIDKEQSKILTYASLLCWNYDLFSLS